MTGFTWKAASPWREESTQALVWKILSRSGYISTLKTKMDELEEQLAQTEDAIEACEKIIQGIKIGVTQSRMPWISKGSPRESILCKKIEY